MTRVYVGVDTVHWVSEKKAFFYSPFHVEPFCLSRFNYFSTLDNNGGGGGGGLHKIGSYGSVGNGHPGVGNAAYLNGPFSILTIMHDIDIDDYHEIQHRDYDNKRPNVVKKHADLKKHR